jgi:hypothetical protein
MTSHSNLQGIVHRSTQSLLFSEGKYSLKKNKEENFRPSLSVTFPDSLGLGYSWREVFAPAEDFPESQLWQTELTSGAGTQELLAPNLSVTDTFVNTWLSSPLTVINTSSREQTRERKNDSPVFSSDQSGFELYSQCAAFLQGVLEATRFFARITSSAVVNAIFVKTKKDENLEENGFFETTFLGISCSEQSNKPKIETHQLEQLYIFREKAEILRFLEEKQFLLSLLEDTYINISHYFPVSDLFLDVVIDPEIANERQLVIFIAIKDNAEEASEALDKFDEEWWMDNMNRAQGSLCITLEFI